MRDDVERALDNHVHQPITIRIPGPQPHRTSSQQRTIKHICEKFGVYSRHRLAKDYETMFGKSIKETIKTAAEY